MSLKGFHIDFIIFSTLLALGIGAWCVWVDLVEGAPIYLAGAICSFAVAVALIVYGVWFYRKMKRLRIIT
jgi:membrane protein YdbS with pleckstrin-like domain